MILSVPRTLPLKYESRAKARLFTALSLTIHYTIKGMKNFFDCVQIGRLRRLWGKRWCGDALFRRILKIFWFSPLSISCFYQWNRRCGKQRLFLSLRTAFAGDRQILRCSNLFSSSARTRSRCARSRRRLTANRYSRRCRASLHRMRARRPR